MTTAKEVVESIQKQRKDAGIAFLGWVNLTVEHYAAVVDALEKQIPKKPTKKSPIVYSKTIDGQEKYAFDYHCPLCGKKLRLSEHHCTCGQALDWGSRIDNL